MRALLRCWRSTALGICGTIGIVAGPALGDANGFDGVYSGKRVLTKGSAQTCPTAEGDVSITIRGEVLTLTGGTLRNFLMGFDPHPDGSFNEIVAGGGGGFVFKGSVVGDAIEADIVDRDCAYHWRLKRSP